MANTDKHDNRNLDRQFARYGRPKFTRVRFVRLMILVTAVIGVVWYARQRENNPFSNPAQVRIQQTGGVFELQYVRQNRHYRIRFDSSSAPHREGGADRPTHIFDAGGRLRLADTVTTALYAIDSSGHPLHIQPAPQISISPVVIDTSGGYGLRAKLGSLHLLCLHEGHAALAPAGVQLYREKLDVVVVLSTHPHRADKIRKLLRPRETIAVHPADPGSRLNHLTQLSNDFALSITKKSNGRISLSQQ
ncbi:MAG: hypothetical protein GF398_08210 [Chitinivibrionales bacterium]|nr:hypothetical protein [Chitinivibrionales bacterium]